MCSICLTDVITSEATVKDEVVLNLTLVHSSKTCLFFCIGGCLTMKTTIPMRPLCFRTASNYMFCFVILRPLEAEVRKFAFNRLWYEHRMCMWMNRRRSQINVIKPTCERQRGKHTKKLRRWFTTICVTSLGQLNTLHYFLKSLPVHNDKISCCHFRFKKEFQNKRYNRFDFLVDWRTWGGGTSTRPSDPQRSWLQPWLGI